MQNQSTITEGSRAYLRTGFPEIKVVGIQGETARVEYDFGGQIVKNEIPLSALTTDRPSYPVN